MRDDARLSAPDTKTGRLQRACLLPEPLDGVRERERVQREQARAALLRIRRRS